MQAVEAELSRRRWKYSHLAKAADLDVGTVGDFMSGQTWPRPQTRGRIEGALGWPAGSLAVGGHGRLRLADSPAAEAAPSAEEVLVARQKFASDEPLTEREEDILRSLLEDTELASLPRRVNALPRWAQLEVSRTVDRLASEVIQRRLASAESDGVTPGVRLTDNQRPSASEL